MEYDMDIKEFSCFYGIWYGYKGVFLFLDGIWYGYKGVFLFLLEYDMDIEEFSCFGIVEYDSGIYKG